MPQTDSSWLSALLILPAALAGALGLHDQQARLDKMFVILKSDHEIGVTLQRDRTAWRAAGTAMRKPVTTTERACGPNAPNPTAQAASIAKEMPSSALQNRKREGARVFQQACHGTCDLEDCLFAMATHSLGED